MIRAIALIAIMLPFVGQQALAFDSLCPAPKALPVGADDLRMLESEFTVERALKSAGFLRTDFAKRIWGPEAVEDFSAWSGHYIGYANSLKSIEGALLRQQVFQLRQRSHELSVAAPKSTETAATLKALEVATKQFCEFIASAEYVD